jgi:hypothetical protein
MDFLEVSGFAWKNIPARIVTKPVDPFSLTG